MKTKVMFSIVFLNLVLVLFDRGDEKAYAYRNRPFIDSSVYYSKPFADGDCHTWVSACDLQTAINLAVEGNQIWIAQGLYLPTDTNDRTISFSLKSSVEMYGGFPSDGGDWASRDPLSHPTILSGDIGASGDNSDNSYHVVSGSGLDAQAVLDGFTITSGNANGTSPNNRGGGMYLYLSDPTLSNLVITGNTSANIGGGIANNRSNPSLDQMTISHNLAANAGGGMSNYLSAPTLSHVDFLNNTSLLNSGGMHNEQSEPVLQHVLFSGNSAVDLGGAMYNEYSNAILTDVIFTGNSSSHLGGGICNSASSPQLTDVFFSGNSAVSGGGISNYGGVPVLNRVTFLNNHASKYGGGLLNEASNPLLTDVSFIANSAIRDGGGLYNYLSSPYLQNLLFKDNQAGLRGGGLYNYDSDSTLVNATFTSNSAQLGGAIANYDGSTSSILNLTLVNNIASVTGGAIYNETSAPTLANAIVWANTPNGIAGSPLTITCSDIQGGYIGVGNLNLDPRLGDLSNYGGFNLTFSLLPGSPMIDAGNPDPSLCPSTDQRGISRPQDGNGDGSLLCDMGAFEYTIPYLYFLPILFH